MAADIRQTVIDKFFPKYKELEKTLTVGELYRYFSPKDHSNYTHLNYARHPHGTGLFIGFKICLASEMDIVYNTPVYLHTMNSLDEFKKFLEENPHKLERESIKYFSICAEILGSQLNEPIVISHEIFRFFRAYKYFAFCDWHEQNMGVEWTTL